MSLRQWILTSYSLLLIATTDCLLFSQDAGRARDEGEQALELAERVRVNAEAQRAEAEGMFLVVQEKERQLAQVWLSLFSPG